MINVPWLSLTRLPGHGQFVAPVEAGPKVTVSIGETFLHGTLMINTRRIDLIEDTIGPLL